MRIPSKTMDKFNKLMMERQQLLGYMENIKTEYNVLTDQYMNGNITWDIGKDQDKLMRIYHKHEVKVKRIESYLNKVRIKYGLPL